MNNYLSEKQQKQLREQGLITESEVVAKQGDLYVAVNVINGTRRTLSIDPALLNESGKRVLRG
tara:strand:- start:132 stop:320 length:189 start_codon:yes stop_codon:yes gene_type:complete